ncbi:MAG: hypothetical protein ABIO70_15980 [Pseudomonadota bacterium]
MSAIERYPDLFDPTQPKPKTTTEDYPKPNAVHGRLYAAVLYLLKLKFGFDGGLTGAHPKFLRVTPNVAFVLAPWEFPGVGENAPSESDKVQVLAVYGKLLAENQGDPTMGRAVDAPAVQDQILIVDPTHTTCALKPDPTNPSQYVYEELPLRIVPQFVRAFIEAVEHYHTHNKLYEKCFQEVRERGVAPKDVLGVNGSTAIYARQLSEVVDRLVEQGIGADHTQLKVYIDNALSEAIGGTLTGRASSFTLDLPDLEEDISVEILGDNVRALSVLYFSAQLEDMRLFAVADKVAEQFQTGMLPVSRGPAGDNLYEYIRSAHNRFTEIERRGLYARAFGFAQGGIDESLPNREFNDLWIRALAATSAYNAQYAQTSVPATAASQVLPAINVVSLERRVNHMQVYKALRDLAGNLSLHGYAMAHFAAVELQQTIKQIRKMLSHTEVLAAYGVRDYFQLVERVAQLYLNSQVNSIRQRVTAQSGSRIIKWLGDKGPILSSPTPPAPAVFMDAELVDNVEKWLAVTGTQSGTVQQFSEPVAVPTQPTIPTLTLGSIPEELKNALGALPVGSVPGVPLA